MNSFLIAVLVFLRRVAQKVLLLLNKRWLLLLVVTTQIFGVVSAHVVLGSHFVLLLNFGSNTLSVIFNNCVHFALLVIAVAGNFEVGILINDDFFLKRVFTVVL